MSRYLKYELKKETLWTAGDFSCRLLAGELCEYFAHSDTYIFPHRGGYAPYYSAAVVEANPLWFEPVESLGYAPEAKPDAEDD